MGRATQRFSRINIDKTADNAAMVLSDYPRRRAMASRWSLGLQSPQITGMPRSDSYGNKAEEQITGHVDDQQFVKKCEVIVREIMPDVAQDENWAKILDYYYMRQLGTDEVIMERLGYSHSAYYYAKKQALCAFAEVWPPFPNELLVFNQRNS